MNYYYNPEVKLLLQNESNQRVAITYTADDKEFLLPIIGNRPPFFTNPIYEQYYTKL